jgi:hypothetical protein
MARSPINPRLTPEGVQEVLDIHFGGMHPHTNQLIHLYDQKEWWGNSLVAGLAQLKRALLLRAIRGIRDEQGFRLVHILGERGYERIVQEELFGSPKEYFLAVKNYYEDRRDDETAVERLKKNCWRRYGVEIPSYEEYLETPDHPQWSDDERP